MAWKVQAGIQSKMKEREWKGRSALGARSLVESASNL